MLEGIMMRNMEKYAVAVRKQNGEIAVETGVYDGFLKNSPIKKLPFVRGVFGFAESLNLGMKALNISSEYYVEEEPKELSPKEKLKEKKRAEKRAQKQMHGSKSKGDELIAAITMIVSIALAVGLFMILPYLISEYFGKYIRNASLVALIEGAVRIVIFITYIATISLMKDIRRLYQYHGAEHKCINCIENGRPLTVDNVLASSRQHKRCGTSFLLYVVAVSVVIFFFIRVDNLALRLVLRIALIPVIAGISYEIIRLAGRSNFFLIQWLSAPGLLLQKLTTKEPDEDMVEVAIASVEAVYDWKAFLNENFPGSLEGYEEAVSDKAASDRAVSDTKDMDSQNAEDEKAEDTLDFDGTYRSLFVASCKKLRDVGIAEAENDARLLLEAACQTDRNTLLATPDRPVLNDELEVFLGYLGERMNRRPVQYILGTAPFMGLEFSVDERVLVPRFDTEVVVEEAMKHVHDGMLLLDMCTGSGCMLLSLLNFSNDTHGIGVDLSADALEVAQGNANRLGLNERSHFIQGDMWSAFDSLKENDSVADLKFDVFVSNPPYIATSVIDTLAPEVKDYEPMMALDGDQDGLKFYRLLLEGAPEYLKSGASVIFEIGYDQGEAVASLMERYGYREIRIVKDLAGLDRVAYCEYIA